MKAKIKDTREITAELHKFLATHHENVECDTCLNVFEDLRNLVAEICEEEKVIDWEQRRYEIAKDVMGAFIASPSYQYYVNNNYYESQHTAPNFVAEDAVKYADALIEELMKGGAGSTGCKLLHATKVLIISIFTPLLHNGFI